MKLNHVLVVYTIPRSKEQKLSLDVVKRILKKHKIRFVLVNRDKLKETQFHAKDLVVAVGGDGTFLRAAQFLKETLIFGVNAEPADKEGFFMKSNKMDFEGKLKIVMGGRFPTKRLSRLEARVNGKKISSLALNEFFIGPRKSYHASKYIIQIGNHKERHKSSGILVATPAGSHAWVSASNGKKMNLDSNEFQFVVREPYQGNVFKGYKIISGILKNKEKIKIVSEMLDGLLVADSVGKEYSIKHGQVVEVRMSKNPINAVWF